MNEKELIDNLNNLKSIQPNPNWKKADRNLMMNQISSTTTDKARGWYLAFKLPLTYMRQMSQPVMAAFLIFGFLLAGSVASLQASRNSIPGDSLYIAKIVSEKTQQVLTFDKKEKVRLGLSFASKRAKELDQVLATEEVEGDKVEQLVFNFKKEITAARTRIEKIKEEKNEIDLPETTPADGEEAGDSQPASGEGTMFTANLEKDEQGIQISDKEEAAQPKNSETEEEAMEPEEEKASDTTTTTQMVESDQATTSEPAVEAEEPKTAPGASEILEQVGALLDNDDYEGIINKLDQADEVIGQTMAGGDVKGEQASSTNETAEEDGDVLGASEENGGATSTD